MKICRAIALALIQYLDNLIARREWSCALCIYPTNFEELLTL